MVRSETKRLVQRVFEAVDWAVLGDVYCDEGGEAFWDAHRGAALRLGCEWADALARRVRRGGVSLYAGAGVAELPAMVAEARELGRRVVAANLREAECAVLDAALRAAGIRADELTIEPCDVVQVLARGPFDHLAMVSLLTDPETWPVTSGMTYGRLPPVLLDVEAFVRERDAINRLVGALLDAVTAQAWITTSVDEVPWLLDALDRRGRRYEADDETLETAIVGDPIGFLRVS